MRGSSAVIENPKLYINNSINQAERWEKVAIKYLFHYDSSMYKKKKVLIMTATGSYNLGDEVILHEEMKFLHGHYGEMVDFVIFTHDRKSALFQDEEVTWAKYFPSGFMRNPLANIWYLLRNIWIIARADIMIIGGGGLIFDNEEGVSFDALLFQWWLRTKIARMAGTTIVFLGISLEVKQVKNKMKLHQIFKKGDFIIVRDEKSAGLLEALEVPCSQIPDIAFLYESVQRSEKLPEKKRIGISLRGWFFGDNESDIPKIYDFFLEKWYDPVFLIHSTEWEEAQNDLTYVRRVMQGKKYNTTNTIEQTLKLYPTLYAVVGMRLHSGILAIAHGLPLIMISYGPKTDEFSNLIDNKWYTLPPHDLTLDGFVKLWEDLERNYTSRQANAMERHKTIRSELVRKLKTL
jgi:polysaccharide pyruvyl transferase WcaK-like protein